MIYVPLRSILFVFWFSEDDVCPPSSYFLVSVIFLGLFGFILGLFLFLIQAIPSYSARRSLFERYVKTRAEEERKEKRAAQKAAIEGFKQLLDEASEVLYCLNLKLICDYCSAVKSVYLQFVELLNAYRSFDFQDINHSTDYQTFRKKWGNDPRFEVLDRKEREHLLSERCHFVL